MNINTFGSVEQYKMLSFLTEKISLMNNIDKKYISSVIQDINLTIKNTETINNIMFRNYVLDLTHKDFKHKINYNIKHRYGEEISSYLKNYLFAKIKNQKIYK